MKEALSAFSVRVLVADAPAVVAALHQFGRCDIEQSEGAATAAESAETAKIHADAEFCLRVLGLAGGAGGFAGALAGGRVVGDFAQIEAQGEAAKSQLPAVLAAVTKLEERLNSVNADLQKNADRRAELADLLAAELPLDFPRETANLRMSLMRVSAARAAEYSAQLGAIELADAWEMCRTPREALFFVVWANSPQVHAQLQEAEGLVGSSPVEFSHHAGTPAQLHAELVEQSEALAGEQAVLEEEKQELAKAHGPMLRQLFDASSWQLERSALHRGNAKATKETVEISGFVATKDLPALEKAVAEVTDAFALSGADASSQNDAPVQLSNPPIVRSFAAITEFFGLPKKTEVDPTPLVAFTMPLFFAFCLSDAGYGALTALCAGAILALFSLPNVVKQGFILLLSCGLATVAMGIAFGGYFGLTPDQLGLLADPAREGMFRFQLFDPVQDLVPRIMAGVYAFGLLHLSVGVGLSGLVAWRQARGAAARAAAVAQPLLTLGAVYAVIGALLAGKGVGGLNAELAPLLLSAAGMAAFFLIFLMGSGKNLLLRPLLGLLIVANEAIGWLSNILSYSRLFALGLATGIIALSFNQIAGLVAASLPLGLGFLAGALIILVGHSANFFLNFIGALVHSGRLHFVEFFGRFYEGGARAFRPFCRQGRYVMNGKS